MNHFKLIQMHAAYIVTKMQNRMGNVQKLDCLAEIN